MVLDAFIIERVRKDRREKKERQRLPLHPPPPPPLPPPTQEEERSGVVDFTLRGRVGGMGGPGAYL